MTTSADRPAPGDLPRLLGHRGASADAPENTLAAFALARAQRADGVELDVRRTADGALVLHHDPVLADGRVIVETASAELPPAVPSLAAALEECAGMVVNVEIKNSPFEPDHDPACGVADDVVALLAARGTDRVLVSSFDIATVDRVRDLDPTIATGLLAYVDPADPRAVDLAAERGHGAIHPWEVTVDADLVARAHGAGLEVNVWTVDDPDRIRALAAAGVDGIVTNVPARAREALRAPRG